jgi:hypothetical protein
VFENRLLRRVFRSKREKVTEDGECWARRYSYFVIFAKYYWWDRKRRIRLEGYVAHVGNVKHAYNY